MKNYIKKLFSIKKVLAPYIPNWGRYRLDYFNQLRCIHKFNNFSDDEKNEYLRDQVLNRIREAYDYTDFYRDLYQKHNINPHEFKSLEDINKLPIITKRDIAVCPEKLLLKNRKSSKLISANTGGSTGNPLKLYRDKTENAIEYAYLDYYLNLKCNKPYIYNMRKIILRGNADSHKLIDKCGCNLVLSVELMNENNIYEVINEIGAFCPAYIHAYPSSILKLYELLKNNELKFDIEFILTSSEKLHSWQIELLEAFFTTRVIDVYGNSEHSSLAIRDGLFYRFDMQYGYTEVVNNKLISTKLIDSPMPLIRYDCGDVCIDSHVKTRFPELLLSEIGGRAIEYLIDSSNNKLPIVSIIFGQHLCFFDYVSDFCIVQRYKGEAEIEYVSQHPIASEIIMQDKERIVSKTNGNLSLNFIKVDQVRKTKVGKKRFLTSLL